MDYSKVVILVSDPPSTKHHRIMMEEMGSKVIHSQILKDIINALDSNYDLIIIDMEYELSKRLISICKDKLREAKLIIITEERASKELLQQEYKQAIILEKPISPSRLNDEVAKALSIPSRKPIRILVRVQQIDHADKSFFLGSLTDISENGMLIETDKNLLIGEQLHISFYLPETGGFVELIGQVRREVQTLSSKVKSYGIRFIEITDIFQDKINRYVARMKAKNH